MQTLLDKFAAESNNCHITSTGEVFLIPFWEISYRGSKLKIQQYSNKYVISAWNTRFKKSFFAAYKTVETDLEVIEALKTY
jgi:hypothetical protein